MPLRPQVPIRQRRLGPPKGFSCQIVWDCLSYACVAGGGAFRSVGQTRVRVSVQGHRWLSVWLEQITFLLRACFLIQKLGIVSPTASGRRGTVPGASRVCRERGCDGHDGGRNYMYIWLF